MADRTGIFPGWHLAEINIARAIAPLTDPLMAGFVAQLDVVNAVADRSSGFVWRLKAEDGKPSSYVSFSDDERIIVNMSVWTSIQALREYVYQSSHGGVYRDRRRWFEPIKPAFALWWVAVGHIPTLDEGRRRLELIKRHGPAPDAFTFRNCFPPSTSSAGGH